jgi:hypothetical protein
MTLVEKRVLREERNYRNMVIQQKKNNIEDMKNKSPFKRRLFRRFYLNRFKKS